MHHTPLQLEDYFFTHVHLEANPDFKGAATSAANLDVEVSCTLQLLQHETDQNRFQLKLAVSATPPDSTALPYRLEVQAVGLFVVAKDFQHEDIPRLVRVNGGSMLYAAAREFVLVISSRGPWGPLKLPTVNLHGAVPGKAKEA
jgi:preprotein translocase subunit SecB